MIRRFRIYIFGFLLGIILVYTSLLKGRSKALLGWMPGARVLKDLSILPAVVSDKASCQLRCLQLGDGFIAEIFENGDVDFSRSRPKETPRFYIVEVEKADKIYEFEVIYKDSITTVDNVLLVESENKCTCN
jgi:hypothetical protein